MLKLQLRSLHSKSNEILGQAHKIKNITTTIEDSMNFHAEKNALTYHVMDVVEYLNQQTGCLIDKLNSLSDEIIELI